MATSASTSVSSYIEIIETTVLPALGPIHHSPERPLASGISTVSGFQGHFGHDCNLDSLVLFFFLDLILHKEQK